MKKGVEMRLELLKHQMSTIKQICENDYKQVTKLETVEVNLNKL